MNLLLYCLFAILACGFAAVDVEKTVRQVQNILQQNSQLPRLSREEILQLLNDIRAEDAKSSASKENSKETSTVKPAAQKSTAKPAFKPYFADKDYKFNEITSDIENNSVFHEKDASIAETSHKERPVESTTKKSENTMMVVLPYTPRDGSSLQELYTRPPRVEVVPVSKPDKTKKINESDIQKTLKNNARLAHKTNKQDSLPELDEFLKLHGLEGKPGQDSFLLPLDGFKPLPAPKVIDGSVELPESILLTYDLISPGKDAKAPINKLPTNNVLYEPLRPELPFELDGSASETEKAVLPLELPKSRIPKATNETSISNIPEDYDSIKVIPLNHGPAPVDSNENDVNANELNKRQTNSTSDSSAASVENKDASPTVSPAEDSKQASTNSAGVSDSGASLSDLEDSFGGAAPSEPGDSEIPPPRKNGFYWMLDWNSFLEVGDGDTKVNIRFEPKLGDPQMFLPVNVP